MWSHRTGQWHGRNILNNCQLTRDVLGKHVLQWWEQGLLELLHDRRVTGGDEAGSEAVSTPTKGTLHDR